MKSQVKIRAKNAILYQKFVEQRQIKLFTIKRFCRRFFLEIEKKSRKCYTIFMVLVIVVEVSF